MLNIFVMLTFLGNLALGCFVYIKDRKSSLNRAFAVVSFSVAIWIFSAFMFWVSNVPLFWGRMMFVGPIILAGAFPYFIYVFPPANRPQRLVKKIVFFIPVLTFLITVPTNFIVQKIISPSREVIYGIGNAIFGIYFIIYMGCAFIMLVKKCMSAKGINRIQITYLLTGTLLSTIAGTTTNLVLPLLGTSQFNRLGPSFTIIFVALTAYAIVRHRLMDIDVVIKKTVIFSGLLGSLYAAVAAITFIARDLIGQHVIVSQNLATLISLSVLIIVFEPIKKILINLTENFLFQKEYNHQEIYDIMSRGIMDKVDLEELKATITKITADTMKLENAFIIEKDEFKNRTITDREKDAGISIPIFLNKEIYWILFLGEKKSGKIFTKEDKNTLESFSRDITKTITIAKYQMDSLRQENLKFVSMLVKDLAHEIFNPLTPLQHSVENLEGEEFLKIYEIYETYKNKYSKEDQAKFKEAMLALREATKSIKTNAQHIHLMIDTLNKMQKTDEKTIGPVDIKMFLKEVINILGMELDSFVQKDVAINQQSNPFRMTAQA